MNLVGCILTGLTNRQASFMHVETVSSLTPMVAGIPDKSQAARMMKKIIAPAYYNTLMPFSSVACNEEVFGKET